LPVATVQFMPLVQNLPEQQTWPVPPHGSQVPVALQA
jgi:hypothetical protein